jgi:four helix bundle protein
MARLRVRAEDGVSKAAPFHPSPMDYEDWQRGVSGHIRNDPLWSLRVYRMALFAGERGRIDAESLEARGSYRTLAEQLRRATESISANITEGFSRLRPRERAHFFEYALGSAREARDWYFKARGGLGEVETESRLDQLGHIIRILTALIKRARSGPAAKAEGTS